MPGPVRRPLLHALTVAADADRWAAAGFLVDDGAVTIGRVRLELVEPAGNRPGIRGWTLSGIDPTDELDGLATTVLPEPDQPGAAAPSHPNGVVGLDHVVVTSPDLQRTVETLAVAGFDLRRIRDTTAGERPMQQAFYRLGTAILEVVSLNERPGASVATAPTEWFGLAADVDDLDRTARHLGPGMGRIKQAVQPGRRIATIRHRELGLGVALALMDRHGERTGSDT